MKIRSKVFLIFIIFNAFWMLLSLLLMQYLARADFQNYLHNRQAHYLEEFAEFLVADDNWHESLASPKELKQRQLAFQPLQSCPNHRLPKLAVLDKNKQPLLGNTSPEKEYFTVSLPDQGQAPADLIQ